MERPDSDPDAWLRRYTPQQWLHAAIHEHRQAKDAYARKNGRAGLAGCRRAAGVALNGVLATMTRPDPRYGRSYMDHLGGLAGDASAPQAVRDAAALLLSTPLPGGTLVSLRTSSSDAKALDAAETVMAHAYACVLRASPTESGA